MRRVDASYRNGHGLPRNRPVAGFTCFESIQPEGFNMLTEMGRVSELTKGTAIMGFESVALPMTKNH
jgi:hypothetical protein